MLEDIDKALMDDFDPEEEQRINQMVVHEPPARTKDVEAVNSSQDAADDYVYVRESLHNTLAQAQEALKGMTEFLNQSPSPRAFEVISGLIKTTSDVAKDLMEHQKTITNTFLCIKIRLYHSLQSTDPLLAWAIHSFKS